MALRKILILACGLAAVIHPALAAPVVGDPAPALVSPKLDGSRLDLATLRGKVVIVNFWATWCVPCREEMPALDDFYGRFHGRGIELIGVSADRSKDRDAVVKMSQTVHYPVTLLTDAETNGFGKPTVLPVTYILDAAGTVRAVLTPGTDAITEQSLEKTVLPLLPAGH